MRVSLLLCALTLVLVSTAHADPLGDVVNTYLNAVAKGDLTTAGNVLADDVMTQWAGSESLNMLEGVYSKKAGWLQFMANLALSFSVDGQSYQLMLTNGLAQQAMAIAHFNVTHAITKKALTNTRAVLIFSMTNGTDSKPAQIMRIQYVVDSLAWASVECAGTLSCSGSRSFPPHLPTAPLPGYIPSSGNDLFSAFIGFMFAASPCLTNSGGDCSKADALLASNFVLNYYGDQTMVPQAGLSLKVSSFMGDYFKYYAGSLAAQEILGSGSGVGAVVLTFDGLSELSKRPMPFTVPGSSPLYPRAIQVAVCHIDSSGKIAAIELFGNTALFAVLSCNGPFLCGL